MPPTTVVNNEYITLQYLPDQKCIYHVIHKPIPDQPLMDALNAGSAALEKYGLHKWFSDDRLNGPLSKFIQDWGFDDWDPRTIKAGWKYWANVVPKQLVAAGALAPVMQAVFGLGLTLQVFASEEEAWQWLDSQEG